MNKPWLESKIARPARDRDGFTLIEVLLAIMLTAMICAVLYGVIYSTMTTHVKISGYNDAAVVADRIADMIARDLQAVYVADYDGGTPFEAENDRELGLEADRLTLVTSTATLLPTLEEDEMGIQGFNEVTYVAVASKTREGYLSLYRREAPLDADSTKGGRFALLHDQVESFEFRYVGKEDEVEWESAGEEWEYSPEKGLPRAVLLSLVISIGEKDTAEDLQDKNYISRFKRQRIYRVMALPPGLDEDMTKLAALEPGNPRAAKGAGGGGGLPGQPGAGGTGPPGGVPPGVKTFNQLLGGKAPPAGGNPLLELLNRHQRGR